MDLLIDLLSYYARVVVCRVSVSPGGRVKQSCSAGVEQHLQSRSQVSVSLGGRSKHTALVQGLNNTCSQVVVQTLLERQTICASTLSIAPRSPCETRVCHWSYVHPPICIYFLLVYGNVQLLDLVHFVLTILPLNFRYFGKQLSLYSQ